MARIKICGLKRQEDIAYANELKPDYIGFILSKGYKRSIDFATANELKKNLSKDIKAVGVFVNEPLSFIKTALEMGIIDIVQLHGDETPEYCTQINAPVIKALKPNDFGRACEYEACVDYFLFDSGAGTGKTFDWNSVVKTNKPFFLAGGLDASNLALAIETVQPYAVDMSSSVETDGVKDYDKIKQVIDIAKFIQP
jgi:phosphoribosylanthranilate isomerase